MASKYVSRNSVNLTVNLTNTGKIFHAGQVVSGKVILNSKVSILIRCLRVHLKGVSSASCSMIVSGGVIEPKIATRYYVTGKQSLITEEKRNPGIYEFDFCVALPEACPSSMKSKL